jgi:4-amino-4-deoxychorismate mutase
MSDKTEGTDLEGLRAQLDKTDERLLDIVRDRIQLCVRIGEYKRQHAIAMMQPHRVNAVHARAEAFAIQNGLNPEFLRKLYDTIIEETCRLEDEVIGNPDEKDQPPAPESH